MSFGALMRFSPSARPAGEAHEGRLQRRELFHEVATEDAAKRIVREHGDTVDVHLAAFLPAQHETGLRIVVVRSEHDAARLPCVGDSRELGAGEDGLGERIKRRLNGAGRLPAP